MSAEQNIVEEILAVRRRIDACQRCATLQPWRKFPVEAFGTIATGYMLIGEAPGYVSWRRQMPYGNPRNYTIREAIESLGHPRYKTLEDLFYLSDVVRCQPSPLGSTANRSPTSTERRNCSDYLQRELELLTPRVIVTVGKLAAEAVLGRPIKITQEHTKRHAGPAGNEVIVLMHPSGRNKQHLQNMGLTLEGYREQLQKVFADLIERLEREGPVPR